MFKNAGEKIQAVAITMFIITVVFSIIISLYLVFDNHNIKWMIIIPISVIISWPLNLFLYAFGELCVDVKKISIITVQHEKNSYNEKKKNISKIKTNIDNGE